MSFFQGDQTNFKKSITYFNSLSEDRKAFLISNMTKGGYNDQELNALKPLVEAIQNDSLSYSQSQIADKLVELSMDKTYAVLFVSNIIKEAPSTEYQLKILNDMNDEDFKKIIPGIIRSIWVDKKPNNEVITELGITDEQLQIGVRIIREAMNEFLRRETSELLIKKTLTSKLSEGKIDTIINTLKVNSEFWRDMLVFSNTQDSYFLLKELKDQNTEILRVLRELLKIFKESQKKTDQSHFQ